MKFKAIFISLFVLVSISCKEEATTFDQQINAHRIHTDYYLDNIENFFDVVLTNLEASQANSEEEIDIILKHAMAEVYNINDSMYQSILQEIDFAYSNPTKLTENEKLFFDEIDKILLRSDGSYESCVEDIRSTEYLWFNKFNNEEKEFAFSKSSYLIKIFEKAPVIESSLQELYICLNYTDQIGNKLLKSATTRCGTLADCDHLKDQLGPNEKLDCYRGYCVAYVSADLWECIVDCFVEKGILAGSSYIIGGAAGSVLVGPALAIIMTIETSYCLGKCNRDNTRPL